MQNTTVEIAVKGNADRLWSVVSAGTDMHKWLAPAITGCALTGAGAGAERRIEMADGTVLKERILDVDHQERIFRYAIEEHPFPARNVVGTIKVRRGLDGAVLISWGADYETGVETAAVLKEKMTEFYTAGLTSLAVYCGATVDAG